jgi:hypothetical protein
MSTINKKYIWVIAVLVLAIAAFIYIRVSSVFPETDQRNIRLEELFALSALSFLYLSLLPNPLSAIFPNSKIIQNYKSLQPILVLSVLFFAGIHASIAFFFLLGGFAGLGFLSQTFLTGVILAVTALTILIIVTLYKFLSKKFHWITNLLYIIGVLIVIHALLLGTDFIILTALIPKITLAGILLLLLLEIIRLDSFINQKNPKLKKFGLTFAVLVIALSCAGFYTFTHIQQAPATSVHANHLAMAGMNTGDSTRRYTLNMSAGPADPKPGQNVTLTFKIFDAASGTQVKQFDQIYTKFLHLVIVDSSLTFFNHIHPVLDDGTFTVTTQFPKNDVYHLYTNFEPTGGVEQQMGVTLAVGNGNASAPSPTVTDSTQTVAGLNISVLTDDGQPFNANRMSAGLQIINFDFKDSQTGQPISDLQPYLGAFGHLVLISEKTYNYIHIHPIPSEATDFGGPTLAFMPYALYEPITPGIYRVFGQFQRNGELFVADFTIKAN